MHSVLPGRRRQLQHPVPWLRECRESLPGPLTWGKRAPVAGDPLDID